ncbi:MAG: hypothetical protein AMXMBFR23_02310 [Chloroflexota bacterium]
MPYTRFPAGKTPAQFGDLAYRLTGGSQLRDSAGVSPDFANTAPFGVKSNDPPSDTQADPTWVVSHGQRADRRHRGSVDAPRRWCWSRPERGWPVRS